MYHGIVLKSGNIKLNNFLSFSSKIFGSYLLLDNSKRHFIYLYVNSILNDDGKKEIFNMMTNQNKDQSYDRTQNINK